MQNTTSNTITAHSPNNNNYYYTNKNNNNTEMFCYGLVVAPIISCTIYYDIRKHLYILL